MQFLKSAIDEIKFAMETTIDVVNKSYFGTTTAGMLGSDHLVGVFRIWQKPLYSLTISPKGNYISVCQKKNIYSNICYIYMN